MKKSAFLFVVLAGILWGTTGVFFQFLEHYGFSPLQITAMRGIVAAVTFAIYVFIKDKTLFRVKGRELIFFLCSGLVIFGTAAFYFFAIQLSSASTAVVLMYTAPVIVMVYSVAFLGEKLNRWKCISVVCMVIGCALVSGIIGGMKFSILGISLGLCSGLCYSAYNILTKISMMHQSNSLSATLYSFLAMGFASVFVCDPPKLAEITMKAPFSIIPLVIGIGICTCVLPYFFYTLALRDMPVGTAAALSIIEPMSATIFSVLIFKEHLSMASAVGIVLILGAIIILNKSDNKKISDRTSLKG